MIQLSERLQVVASYVEQDAILADIGSDHAYLPTYLVQKGVIKKAVAGEVVKGPYESALKNVQREDVSDAVTVRLANGLFAIQEQDGVDTVSIAGMGGPLIAKILDEGNSHLTSVKRIITQPNIHAKAIREWAVNNDWVIIDERILKEDGKIYEVVVLEKGKASYSEADLLLGPILSIEKNHVFNEKWLHEIDQWNHIVHSLGEAKNNPIAEEKRGQLNKQIQLVEEVLQK
ncbi:tRNA (adenine(22)-N(1))-methyltransferase TrmK [Sporosarcina pasteurii]|uniref:tRNA (Adenine(22)-N(1))-methyltransferase n=1 Tax=Sporosarcina pasteurii TaxID=1474 RepID=A0A380BN48_SPOPA|nr:tRNA (adenine(22)-N(1))-methyltransferase TrmK [Sporosarcina pasteurii]MDS9471044.1 tRNA (adenine(22)-N(1))-methyltransferase TrmK [Sporosarcina pasteurii]QBQ05310.1 tRNA (adenine-N(1))-methyltransferase [Sporosarcina pasteurii]SUJ04120.1 tRNA (adenine(22)-N(1))-methyltransferase [Sporosarcina pasteurii]